MTGDEPLWLTEADVSAVLDLPAVYDALRGALARESAGLAAGITKVARALDGGGSLHSLGATDGDLAGFKNWINTPAGAQAYYLLFDAQQGKLLAAFQAGVLGALRTAATAAVATDHYAHRSADTAAVLGTGRQAIAQLAAIHLVRPLASARVWSPDAERRTAFAARASANLGIDVAPAASVRDAVKGTRIVSTVTRSSDPILDREPLEPGTHVNAMGAILPHALEVDPSLLVAADELVVDDVANARLQSRELAAALALDPGLADRLVPLHALASRRAPASSGVTVLKSVGAGLSDLAAARALLDAAASDGRHLARLRLAAPTALPRLARI